MGFRPRSIAVGDFNGDGIDDLATAHCGSRDVSVLLGNGDGTFQPERRGPYVGECPTSIAVGDFNGDGKEDVVTANLVSGDVTILLGNGDGSFRAFRVYATDDDPLPRPNSVVVGDFNGDGIQDLAVANDRVDNVAVLLGNGDGTFQRIGNFHLGASVGPRSVVIGDFNRDGIQDLATANSASRDVSILIGNGDGTFQQARNFPTGEFRPLESVAVGDFNDDGIEDLAAVGWSINGWTLLGNGDGSFQPARAFAVGWFPLYSVVVGDFNGDGKQDLALANTGLHSVSILLGNGDGSFQQARNFPVGNGPLSVAIGDFDGDKILDLATVNHDSDSVTVLLGNGDGRFK